MAKQHTSIKTKLKRKMRKASEGMTSAIIMIAFIITASGIAFVVLTMGQEFQISLGNVGDEGKDTSSSVMQVQGGIVNAYGSTIDSENQVVSYTFDLKLVLENGQTDLSSDAITVSIIVGHNNSLDLGYSASITTASNIESDGDNKYGVHYYNEVTTNGILEPTEIARFLLHVGDTYSASENTEVSIIIMSEVATIRIDKTIPVGVLLGSNLI